MYHENLSEIKKRVSTSSPIAQHTFSFCAKRRLFSTLETRVPIVPYQTYAMVKFMNEAPDGTGNTVISFMVVTSHDGRCGSTKGEVAGIANETFVCHRRLNKKYVGDIK